MRPGVLRRAIAYLALCAWVGGLVLPAFGLAHTFDLEAVATHDTLGVRQSVVKFESVPPSATEGHCAVCHLQRAVRGAALVAPGSLVFVDLPAFEVVAVPFGLAAAEPDLLPSRGPPSLSIS